MISKEKNDEKKKKDKVKRNNAEEVTSIFLFLFSEYELEVCIILTGGTHFMCVFVFVSLRRWCLLARQLGGEEDCSPNTPVARQLCLARRLITLLRSSLSQLRLAEE